MHSGFDQVGERAQRGAYSISSDKQRLDRQLTQQFLTKSYWATGITLQEVSDCIENSLCFGVYEAQAQVGFARVITDLSTFGYLADVFILPGHRRKGLGEWLVETILAASELKKVSFWLLLTKDAQSLYKKFGFHRFDYPEGVMVQRR